MDRAFSSGASGSAPTAPASPSVGYPTAGNPITGTPATKPGPYWYHMVMEELLAVIGAAGISPAQNNLAQLLTALRSAGVFQTPAQFDNSTKAATTAFVKNSGFTFSGAYNQTLPLTMSAAHIGQMLLLTGSGTATLPVATTGGQGGVVSIFNVTLNAVVVNRAGSDQIVINGGAYASSIVIPPGETLILVTSGTTLWYAVGGSAQMVTNDFVSSKTSMGYQKLPGGLIIQWGAQSVPANTNTTIALAIAYPTAHLVATGNRNSPGSNAQFNVSNFGGSLTTVNVQNYAGSAEVCSFISIGY